MFTQIKTSTKNRENVVELTRKFNLGAENVIARMAEMQRYLDKVTWKLNFFSGKLKEYEERKGNAS